MPMIHRPGSIEVVVTGLGSITPIGNDAGAFWKNLLAGRSGAAPIRSFDTRPYRTSVGCEVKDFTRDPGSSLPASLRATQLAAAAIGEALRSAGIDSRGERPAAIGLAVGTTMGELNFLDRLSTTPAALGGNSSPAIWQEAVDLGAFSITSMAAEALGLDGPQATLPAACSAGNYAIGQALDWIRRGKAEILVAGGAEAFSESAFAGFSRLGAMSPDVCRPFDLNRKGLLLGEGAGFLVLENAESARRRGATALAKVLGFGLSCDAHHITGPHPEGAGAVECMRSAMEDAGVAPPEIGYISLHGTGTRQNDKIESQAIREVFGERTLEVPASSIKALTGHMMGAASAVEAIACVLAMQHGVLPPTWNHETRDPDCNLDVIPNAPRPARLRAVLNNSYAFGGNNACVVFGAP